MNAFVICLVFYACITLVIGWTTSSSSEKGFILSRTLNKWSVGISASATASTGFVVTGAVGMGYTLGVGSLLYPVSWLIGDIVFWFFAAEKLHAYCEKRNADTVPEMLSDSGLLKVTGAVFITVSLLLYSAAQFSAVSKAVSPFIELPDFSIMFFSLVFIVIYSFRGGYKASVATDVFQGLCMIALTLGLLLYLLNETGGVVEIINSLNIIDSSLVSINSIPSIGTLVAFVAGFAFSGYGFLMGQPQVTNRIMGAKNLHQVKGAKWVYIGVLHFLWIGMCLIGMIIRIKFGDISDPEMALSLYSRETFTPYISALVLLGIFSAIISSLDSLILTCSSTFSSAVMGSTEQSIVTRVIFILTGTVAVFLAFYVDTTVFELSLFSASFLAASIGAALTIKIFSIKHSELSLSVGVLLGGLLTIVWKLLGLSVFIHEGLLGFLLCLLFNFVIGNFVAQVKKVI